MRGSDRGKRGALGRAAGLTLLLALASCSPPPLKLGFVGPLTGSSSAIGTGCRNGFLMALGDGKGAAKGRIPSLDLIVKDDRNDPEACLEAFQELRKEGCDIVVLGSPSQAASMALPWALAQGMLVVSPTVSSSFAGDENPRFVRVNAPSADYGLALAHAAAERFGLRRVGIVGDSRNETYVDAVVAAFRAEYAKLGGASVFGLFFDSSKERPPAELAARLREGGCDALLAVTASTEAVLVAKDVERAGLRVRLLLPPWPLTLDLIQNGGKAVDGAVAVSIADLEYRSPSGRLFESAYREEYGETPSFTAMFGWEAASILRSALAGPGPYTAAAVDARILSKRHFEGLQGSIDFDSTAKATRTMFYFTVEEGAFRRLE